MWTVESINRSYTLCTGQILNLPNCFATPKQKPRRGGGPKKIEHLPTSTFTRKFLRKQTWSMHSGIYISGLRAESYGSTWYEHGGRRGAAPSFTSATSVPGGSRNQAICCVTCARTQRDIELLRILSVLEMEVTKIILAKVSKLCQLSSHSRGVLSRI